MADIRGMTAVSAKADVSYDIRIPESDGDYIYDLSDNSMNPANFPFFRVGKGVERCYRESREGADADRSGGRSEASERGYRRASAVFSRHAGGSGSDRHRSRYRVSVWCADPAAGQRSYIRDRKSRLPTSSCIFIGMT